MKRIMPQSNAARGPTVAGNIAGIGKVIFPPEDSLESATGPWLQGLLPSRDGAWPFEGISACLWHGGSEFVDGGSILPSKAPNRQGPTLRNELINSPARQARKHFRKSMRGETNPTKK